MEIKLDKYQPRTYQLPIFDAIENKDYKRVLCILPRRCLSGSSHILMADGSWSFLKDINAGDRVLSWNGETFVEDVVKHLWTTDIKKTKILNASRYLKTTTSEDHVFASTSSAGDIISWAELKSLGNHRKLLQYAGMEAGKVHNPDLASFWGYMLADGYVSGYQQPKFTNKNKEILERVQELVLSLFNVLVIWREKGNGYDLGFSNGTKGGGVIHNPVKELFRSEGADVPKYLRRLPASIWQFDRDSLLWFFSALISADGSLYIGKKGFIASDTGREVPPSVEITISCGKNDLYVWDIYWLLRKIGVIPSVPRKERDENWKIRISKNNDVKTLLSTPIYGKRAKQREVLSAISNRTKKTQKVHGCYRTKLSYVDGQPEKLYDLETEKHHNFVANGYVVHNSGKDVTAFQIAIRQCIMKPCVVYYIFPTYAHARKVIWDSLTNDGERFLDYIPEQLIESTNETEMKIRFKNGSLLQLVGSERFDSLMGTNPKLCIFSEYALQDPRAYQYIRPILTANDGTALFISCVAPDTIIIGERGLQRIETAHALPKQPLPPSGLYVPFNKPVYGLGGYHQATDFYYGGVQPIVKITTHIGTEIKCTAIHPLWNGTQWIKAGDIKTGAILQIQYGQNIWGPGLDLSDFPYKRLLMSDNFLDHQVSIDKLRSYNNEPCYAHPDVLYLLGVLYANMTFNTNQEAIVKQHLIVVRKQGDELVINFLRHLGFRTQGTPYLHRINSPILDALLRWLGCSYEIEKRRFPDKILQCTREQMIAFIQGLFDGGSTAHSNPRRDGRIIFSSFSEHLIKTLQVVLLNFGIVSRLHEDMWRPRTDNREDVWRIYYILEIRAGFASRFMRQIGFRSKGVQPAVAHGSYSPFLMGSAMQLRDLHSGPSYYQARVTYIEPGLSPVYDFVIPETHSFFSNGFVSHNTPRGKNHLWDLYNIAKQSPDWFCYKLTIEDTKHIPLSEIEKEREDGIMSEDLIQQEYYTSFNMGVEGSYYLKYLDRMRVDGHIGKVPWEHAYQVHTAWDIGVRDATSIILFQIIGGNVRIIDCYDRSKEGLEHYIKVLSDKPYIYGKHFAPHDIAVQEWGSGLTRIEKAKQLGIKFVTVPNISVEDGIENVRSSFSKIWIDAEKCEPLLKALENYRQEYDIKRRVYKSQPLHDWSSHYADAMRYLCLSLPKTKDGLTAESREKTFREAIQGPQGNLPSFFRDDDQRY